LCPSRTEPRHDPARQQFLECVFRQLIGLSHTDRVYFPSSL
jgi:hypothetical protein